jgi:hypothetical protein
MEGGFVSLRDENGNVILSTQEKLRRNKVAAEIDDLFQMWRRDTEKAQGSPVTPGQKVNYFRELAIESLWRKWPL